MSGTRARAMRLSRLTAAAAGLALVAACGTSQDQGSAARAARVVTDHQSRLLGFRADAPFSQHQGDSVSLCPLVQPGLPAGLSYSVDVAGTASLRMAMNTDLAFSYDKDAIAPGATLPVSITYSPGPGGSPNASIHIPVTFTVKGCVKDCLLPDLCDTITLGCSFDAGPTDFVAPLDGDAPITVPVSSCTVSLNVAGVVNVGSAHVEGAITLAPVPVSGPGIGGAAAAFGVTGPASPPPIPLLQWNTAGQAQTANLKMADPLPGAADVELKLSPVFHWLATSGDLKLVINLSGVFHDVGISDPSPITVFSGNLGPIYSGMGLDTQVSNAVKDAIGVDPGFGPAIAAGKVPVPLTDPELQQIGPSDPPTFGSIALSISTDTTPPTTTAAVVPAPTPFGWNNTPVDVTLTAVDPGGTGVASVTYAASGAQTIATTTAPGSSTTFGVSAPGVTTVTFHATDLAGNVEADRTVVVRIDEQPPTIAIAQPAATTYPHSTTLTLDYSVSDTGGSGLDVVTVLLDGAPTLAGHGLASGQAIDLLTELPLGTHVFSISATDQAGNASSQSVTFEIVVTPESIKDDVAQFLASGKIKNPGLANSLLAKLNAAADARARGQCGTAANVYRAFVHELQAQGGKGVDATAAAIMIADAEYLIAHCP